MEESFFTVLTKLQEAENFRVQFFSFYVLTQLLREINRQKDVFIL